MASSERAAFNSAHGDRLRILINGIHSKSGGGVTYLRNMLPRLADDRRFELHLVIHADQYGLYAPFDERVRVRVLDFSPGFWRLLAWEQFSLPFLARAMGADVTFSPANFGPLFAPAPVIVLRNALAVAKTERRLCKRFYWTCLGAMTAFSLVGCRRAIAVSDYTRRTLTFRLPGWVSRKVAVVHHGVDGVFSSSGNEAGTSTAPRFLLAVADIYIQKNLHTLIAALSRVHETDPGIVLKIAGTPIDEDYYERLNREITVRRLDDYVHFLGRLDTAALTPLYRNCAAFVFPSTVETFGNPLLEAMACGAPIACSSAAAMPEVVGDAAVLFDPNNEADMANAIARLLCEQNLAKTLKEKGLARARLFSWEHTARLTGDILAAASRRPLGRLAA